MQPTRFRHLYGLAVLQRNTMSRAVLVGTAVILPELAPGNTWQGEKISGVEHHILPDGACRTRLYFEFDSISERGRIAANTNAPYTVLTDDNPYRAVYLGKVVAQSADLATVDVELEPDVPVDKRVLPGLVRVPIYGSVPGMVVEIDANGSPQYCAVGFLNNNRATPFILGWLGASMRNDAKRAAMARIRGEAIQLGNNGNRKVARDNDPISAGSLC